MAQQYIVGFSQSDIEDVGLTIVNAENEEHALDKFAKTVGIKEEDFIAYVYDRSVSVSLAENFWLQTEEEQEAYESNGEVLIDEDEFRRRVSDFFGENQDYAELYLEYYYGNRVPDEAEFPEEMLLYIWFEAQWAEVLVVPLAELPVID